MKKATVKIENKLGFHLRAAAYFIQVANKFKSEIFVEKDRKKVNGKSIMSLMSLVMPYNSIITIIARGKDEKKALEALVNLVKNKFGEKE